jgi:hypothetical protein
MSNRDYGKQCSVKKMADGGSVKAPAPAPAPAPTPPQLGGMAGAAQSALRDRRKRIDEAAGYADGGEVDQPTPAPEPREATNDEVRKMADDAEADAAPKKKRTFDLGSGGGNSGGGFAGGFAAGMGNGARLANAMNGMANGGVVGRKTYGKRK